MITVHSKSFPPSHLIPVFLILPHHLVSQSLKSAIIRAHNLQECDSENTVVRSESDWNSLDKEVTNLVITKDVCNDMKGDVVIEGLHCLKSILVKRNSMMNLNRLKICNCAMLERIETESDAFASVKSVEISSLIDLIQLIRSSSIDYIHYRI